MCRVEKPHAKVVVMTNDRTRIIACSKPWRSSAGLRTTRCTCAHLDKAAANLQESSVFQNRTMRANAHRRRWARNDFTFAPAMYLGFSIHKPASPSVPDLMDGPSWTNNRRELSIVQLHTSSNAVRRPTSKPVVQSSWYIAQKTCQSNVASPDS